MVKMLSGRDIADYMKNRQFSRVRELRGGGVIPTLAIIRDNENPVIDKYVHLKKSYGEDIGVKVVDIITDDVVAQIEKVNKDTSIHGLIVQLPLKTAEKEQVDEILNKISPEKDVDGLGKDSKFDSATATAIHWLLASYNIPLKTSKIAVVGRGRLVGGPLIKIFKESGYDFDVFGRDSDLQNLVKYDIIVVATGVPGLIKSEMVKNGAVIVDAGTASDKGKLVGDVDEKVREREDLTAITPKIGGVGPLTVATLFEHLLAVTR